MASVASEQYMSFDGWDYVVVSAYKGGYAILLNTELIYKWCILNPDGSLTRFKTESELWQYAIEKKLFKKKKRKEKKNGNC